MHWILLLLACNGERPIDPIDTDNTPECTEDEQCNAQSICDEDQTCTVGDRDNDIASATPILKTTDPEDNPSAEGVIQTEGDVDYYSFEALEPQWVRIQTVSEVPEELDTVIAILDASGGVHAWIDNFGTGRINRYDSVLHAYLPTAGTWTITVQDRGTWFNLDEEAYGQDLYYQLSILDFGNTTTETDSFDLPSVDVDITSGTSIYTVGVNLKQADDSDFITIQLPYNDAPIEVYSLSELPGSDAHPRVQIRDDAGTLLSDKSEVGEEGVALYPGAQSGTYTLEVSDVFTAGSDNHWFPLYIRTRPEGEHYTLEVEPNSTRETPQALPSEALTTDSGLDYTRAWVQGTLGEDGDEDWFTFDATAGDRLTVRCDGSIFGSQGDMQMEMFNAAGTLQVRASDGTDAMPDMDNFGPVTADATYNVRFFNENDAPYGVASFYRCVFFATTFEINTP